FIMGSMHTGLDGRDDATPRLAEFYAERARGGVPLLVTGGWSPNLSGRLSQHPICFAGDEVIPIHKPVTDAVHEAGGRLLLQLVHCGRYAFHDEPVGASPIRSPINRHVPRELTGTEVEATIDDFVRAAALSVEAGYDGIEVMGSEGYLITQFLATRTNHREDEWGGSLENRARFALEILRGSRRVLGPDKILMYRISALDLVEGGLNNKEIQWLARQCEALGVDILNTGIGWHEVQIPTISAAVPRAAFTAAVRNVTDAVSIPVAATNRINMPEVAERVVASGEADMVSLARPFLADSAFVKKAQNDESDRINTCIACNQACLDHYFEHKVSSCLVNPRAGFETEIVISPTAKSRRYAVVGAGPAGLACATTLGARGHQVTLFEASDCIGGQFNLAKNIPGKEEFNETLRYFAGRIKDTDVDLRLNTPAAVNDLADYDGIILSTGVVPRAGVIPGEDHPKVVTYPQVLTGEVEVGEKVAIIGAGGIGFDMAIYLIYGGDRAHLDPKAFAAHWGIGQKPHHQFSNREITMLQRSPGGMGKRLGKTTGWVHRMEIAQAGVKQISGATYTKVDDQGLHIEVDGEARLVDADTIVICAGQESVREVPDTGFNGRIHVIGGAKEAGELDAKRAFDEGVRLGASL
ncbi:MAG: NADPH-dependent 2,4-dienoyl-CoA reductase, partial [Fimbriimonadaceae bacterium]|nr:NADPH-dependent 2,4-dienoyl-CoA reductase [Alphaproteobacteria bacterium]